MYEMVYGDEAIFFTNAIAIHICSIVNDDKMKVFRTTKSVSSDRNTTLFRPAATHFGRWMISRVTASSWLLWSQNSHRVQSYSYWWCPSFYYFWCEFDTVLAVLLLDDFNTVEITHLFCYIWSEKWNRNNSHTFFILGCVQCLHIQSFGSFNDWKICLKWTNRNDQCFVFRNLFCLPA